MYGKANEKLTYIKLLLSEKSSPFSKGELYENNTISQNFKFLYRTIVISNSLAEQFV